MDFTTIITGIIGVVFAVIIYIREDLKIVTFTVKNEMAGVITCQCYAKDKVKARRLITQSLSTGKPPEYLLNKAHIKYRFLEGRKANGKTGVVKQDL